MGCCGSSNKVEPINTHEQVNQTDNAKSIRQQVNLIPKEKLENERNATKKAETTMENSFFRNNCTLLL
jgi:hypothetical protein